MNISAPTMKSGKLAAIALGLGLALSAAPFDPAFAGQRHHPKYYGGGYQGGYNGGGYNGGDLLAAGVLGAFIGAVIAPPPVYLAPQPEIIYVEPPIYEGPAYLPDEPYYEPDPRFAYGGDKYPGQGWAPARRPLSGIPPYGAKKHHGPKIVTYDETIGDLSSAGAYAEPWSQPWLSYCRATYRSFDARTGTFKGFDGLRHFCTVR